MEYINGVSTLYIRKFARKLEQYNNTAKLPDYFAPMIGNKKQVKIAELGAGPINTIGNAWPDTAVEIFASDSIQPEYEKLWKEHGAVPVVPIVYENMERLTYPDAMFDIVHCVNAVDHTPDARAALAEFHRVCKPGGWIYLRHAPDQMRRFGGMHAWNIRMEGGECVFEGKHERFMLEGFESRMERGEKEDLIVSVCQKT